MKSLLSASVIGGCVLVITMVFLNIIGNTIDGYINYPSTIDIGIKYWYTARGVVYLNPYWLKETLKEVGN